MNVSIITLGCKVNQYESQAILSQLQQAGFSLCREQEAPDIIILNSCTVTATSDQKVRQTLRRLRRHHPLAVLVLTGCMPQAAPEAAAALTEADIVLGNTNRSALASHLFQYLQNRVRIVDISAHQEQKFEPMTVRQFHDRTRAFVKIEDGCNRFCSYCIIPTARGRVRSKEMSALLQELQDLASNHYLEIVLTGINLSAYGQDLGLHLCDAVETACAVAGIQRVRLGSLEPEQLPPEVIHRLAKQKKLCPQFHLSLQSGCDATLRRMNRHYTIAQYREIVAHLRAAFENAAITTDMMVGFPGETEEEFRQSLAFVEEIGFARVHVFPFSRRPGTKANEMPDQLPKQVKEERARQMTDLVTRQKLAFHQSQCGQIANVLFEQETKPASYHGYTENYTPVVVSSPKNIHGLILPTRISRADAETCYGVLL